MDELRKAILAACHEEMPYDESIDNLSDDLNLIVEAFNLVASLPGSTVKPITDADLAED